MADAQVPTLGEVQVGDEFVGIDPHSGKEVTLTVTRIERGSGSQEPDETLFVYHLTSSGRTVIVPGQAGERHFFRRKE